MSDPKRNNSRLFGGSPFGRAARSAGPSTRDGVWDQARESMRANAWGDQAPVWGDAQAGQRAAVPVLLGRYKLVERVGDGGFGDVNLCWDTRLQRRVAIKRIPIVADGSEHVASTVADALQEARTASMLMHPNIVTVYDFETDDDYAYLVMEYVDGVNLTELLRRVEDGMLSPDEAAHVLSSLVSALKFAHDNGVLHLDIKPSNVMIDRSGVVKLGDFGMASLNSAAGYAGARGGTVGYMPPEQIQGRQVDERSDIFSLATVIWYSLTGASPFAAKNADASLEAIFAGPKRSLTTTHPEIEPEAEFALLHAMSPSAKDRTATVAGLGKGVIGALGNPTEGQGSLRYLMSQLDEETTEEEVRERMREPISEQMPWLPALVSHLVAALSCGLLVMRAMPAIMPGNARAMLIASGVTALLAGIWQPIGVPLAAAAVALALGSSGSRWSIPLALALLVPLFAWWVVLGRRHKESTPAMLLPCVLGSPLACVPVAGAYLGAAGAALTCAVAYLAQVTVSSAESLSYDAGALLGSLGQALSHPATWVGVVGAAVFSAVCGAITSRGTRASGVLGQVVALLGTVATMLVCTRLENGGIWAPPKVSDVVIALVLVVSVCIAAMVFPQDTQLEEDDVQ